MKRITVMLKPASSLCNMRCAYCFYSDISKQRKTASYGVMTCSVAEKVINHLLCDLVAGDCLTIAFQGGEPTIAGLDFYRHFVSYTQRLAAGIQLKWVFQTNGLVLDEAWCAFFKENEFLVGLSFDLGQQDNLRKDAVGKGTEKRVLAAKKRLEQYGVEYNVLCVLTNDLARHPQRTWKAILKHKIQYIQFIPCLDALCADQPSHFALTPEKYASFYRLLIPLWKKAYDEGRYISVKLIDDLLNLMYRGQVGACGLVGQCSPQFVVEADGSVYPCDFYMVDQYRIGSLCENGLRDCFDSPVMRSFSRCREPEIYCQRCRYLQICGGGCKRMASLLHNPSYCGHKEILDLLHDRRFYTGQWGRP